MELSISYDIIKRMAGTITAENRREGEARFRVAFPPAEASDDSTPEAATYVSPPLAIALARPACLQGGGLNVERLLGS